MSTCSLLSESVLLFSLPFSVLFLFSEFETSEFGLFSGTSSTGFVWGCWGLLERDWTGSWDYFLPWARGSHEQDVLKVLFSRTICPEIFFTFLFSF